MGYKCFKNGDCEFFPCHKGINEEEFNCIFCFCPLYSKGTECGGSYTLLENGVKNVEKGVFGADMKVELLNDGPVTILYDSEMWRRK